MRWMKAQLFLVVAVVAMLFAVSLPAQAEAVHAGRRSQRFPVVSPPYTSPQFIGLVTDPDGHPVPGVQIVGNVDGVTGSDGRYAVDFTDVTAINFQADFVPPQSTGLAIFHASGGVALPTAVEVNVVLPRAGQVAGTVLGVTGSPVAGASVTVVETGFPYALGPQRTVTSGPDGTFEVRQVAPGQNFVDVTLPGGGPPFRQAVTVTSGQTTTLIADPNASGPPPIVPEAPLPVLLPVTALLGAAAMFDGAGDLVR
jgi:hypothetical protein